MAGWRRSGHDAVTQRQCDCFSAAGTPYFGQDIIELFFQSWLVVTDLTHKASPFGYLTCVQTLDFSQYIFRLGFHFKVCQFTVLMIHDTQLVLNGVQHL